MSSFGNDKVTDEDFLLVPHFKWEIILLPPTYIFPQIL